jgi:hypothetical protein
VRHPRTDGNTNTRPFTPTPRPPALIVLLRLVLQELMGKFGEFHQKQINMQELVQFVEHKIQSKEIDPEWLVLE